MALFDLIESQNSGLHKDKIPCVGPGALYKNHCTTVLLTTDEIWEWGKLDIVFDDHTEQPPDNHWLNYEMETIGLNDMIGIDHVKGAETFLLQNGLAPYQSFYMRLWAKYHRDYWGEYDVEIDYEILNIKPLYQIQAATEWEAYFARKHGLIMPWAGGKLTK